jgi:hypothetical protein
MRASASGFHLTVDHVGFTLLVQQGAPLIFYDLYVQDTSGTLFPVPVKLLNYRLNNNLVNMVGSTENMVSFRSELLFLFLFLFSCALALLFNWEERVFLFARRLRCMLFILGSSNTCCHDRRWAKWLCFAVSFWLILSARKYQLRPRRP